LDENPTTEELKLSEVKARGKDSGKLSLLRHKLSQKAKQEAKFRFYALYDRMYRRDVLWAAWEKVKANGGKGGVDGLSIEAIENAAGGAERLVEELHQELLTKSYKPKAVRRVYIEKPDGKKRPLGIPTVRDRVVQTACLLILEPIFEADFEDCSYVQFFFNETKSIQQVSSFRLGDSRCENPLVDVEKRPPYLPQD
jgi:RNA-directed DNA polymerase